ncbi:NAC domain-containing protein 55 [Ziziphus jujuba]|uniref:NAC domain-containing protein 55 n=1 Tax=Ziziphus jujuba TaxID=326968 RepID=A0ABM4AHS5_ZIZJJ|nr:NAC domain-containing protein 55 [Ziziphus jujuba]
METYYRKKVIPGELFVPSDRVLIHHYLRKKVMNHGHLLQSHSKIHDVNLYDFHPQHLTDMFDIINGEDWYFFTPRNRKYPNGNRPNRSAANGYWKPTGSDTIIKKRGKEIGSKKCLDYYTGKHPGGTKTEWKMHEYRLMDSTALPAPARYNNMDMKKDTTKKQNNYDETGQISYTAVQHPNEEQLKRDETSFDDEKPNETSFDDEKPSYDHETVEAPYNMNNHFNDEGWPSNILWPNNITPFQNSGLLDHQGYLQDDVFPMSNLDSTMTSCHEQYFDEIPNQLPKDVDLLMNWNYKTTAGDYHQQQQQPSTTFFGMSDQIAIGNDIDSQLINAKPYEASGYVGLQGYLSEVLVDQMKNGDEDKTAPSSFIHNQQQPMNFDEMRDLVMNRFKD